MYLNWQAVEKKSFSVIKMISAAIRQQHILAGHPSPTEGVFSSTVLRAAGKRQMGTRVENVKEPWKREHLEEFVADMCGGLASAPMYITGLLAMCSFASFGRFSCLAPIRWRNITWKEGHIVIHFEKRKNDHFREGSEVSIPENKEKRSACVYRLFEYWRSLSPAASDNDYVFFGLPSDRESHEH